MNKRFFGAIFLSILISSFAIADECKDKTWQFSRLDIETTDVGYLETVMGFSYGPEVTKFIPGLELANSNMFYVESKAKPLITYFTAEFKSGDMAEKAFKHLRAKWADNKYKQYDVFKNGNSVTWFGNNRLSPNCFNKTVSEEKLSLAKK